MEDLYLPGFGPTKNSNGSGDSLNKDPIIDGDRNLATNEVVESRKSAISQRVRKHLIAGRGTKEE